jgi:hypothetical protein
MAYLPPPGPGASSPGPASLGSVIATGSAVAIACATAVGLFSGITGIQSVYAAIALGWAVGLTISRRRSDTPAAIAGAIIALAGSALASVIAVTLRIANQAHVPLAVVLGHLPLVIPAVPQAIGWFGLVCWALTAALGWVTIVCHRPTPTFAPTPATQCGGPAQQPRQLDRRDEQPTEQHR